MIDRFALVLLRPIFERAAVVLAARGITADQATLTGFGFGMAAAVMIGFGYPLLAILPLLINRALDGLDGALARRTAATERGAFLDALGVFCARVGEREQRVLDLIGEQPRSLAELVACRVVYKPEATDAWVDDAERRSIEQHLEELVARERIVLRDDGRYRRAA